MRANNEFYAQLFALHQRMLTGDPTLLGSVAVLVLEPLMAQLRSEFCHVDDELTTGGAVDALMEYAKAPSQANATNGAGVMGFIVMRSKSRVVDQLRKERRRSVAEGGFAHGLDPSVERKRGKVVELRRVRTEHDSEGLTPVVSTPPAEVEERLEREAQINGILTEAKSDMDRRLLEMMFAGVRETVEYARVLGIETEPVEVQEATVKRHKDRLLAAAKRREEAKNAAPKRLGRPPRADADGGGDRG